MRNVRSLKFHINGEKYWFRPPAKTTAENASLLLPFMVAAITQGKIDVFDLGGYLTENNLWDYFTPVEDKDNGEIPL